MKRLHISPATAIACVALFFSLGGVGYAAARHYRIWSIHQIKPSVRAKIRAVTPPTITHIGGNATASPDKFGQVTLQCPFGYVMLGGSYLANENLNVWENYAPDSISWVVSASVVPGITTHQTLIAAANCVKF